MRLENRIARSIRTVGCLAVMLGVNSFPALAIGSFYDSHCEPCHGPERTCDGCHEHKGNLSASPDKDGYQPGEAVVVTLYGGGRGGWVRGILYNEDGTEVGRTDHVPFPVEIAATAPLHPGAYNWEAAWFGNTATHHIEVRTPVMIAVAEPPASVEEEADPSFLTETWGKIKSLFR